MRRVHIDIVEGVDYVEQKWVGQIEPIMMEERPGYKLTYERYKHNEKVDWKRRNDYRVAIRGTTW